MFTVKNIRRDTVGDPQQSKNYLRPSGLARARDSASHKYTPKGVKLMSSAATDLKGRRGRHQQNILCECPLTSRPRPGAGPGSVTVTAGLSESCRGVTQPDSDSDRSHSH